MINLLLRLKKRTLFEIHSSAKPKKKPVSTTFDTGFLNKKKSVSSQLWDDNNQLDYVFI